MRQLTGLFLGAGASYEAGMPLVWELTQELRNFLTLEKLRGFNLGWRLQGGGHPDEVIDSFGDVLARSDLHYEALLGYLETQFRRHQPNQQHYHGLYLWLVQMVYYFLYSRHIENLAFFNKRLPLYAGISALAEQNKPLWIFSLNHDLIVEACAARFGIKVHSGFSDRFINLPRRDKLGKKIGNLRAQVLSEEELKGGFYFPNPPSHGIYLLKIHGALDVFAYDEGKGLLKLAPDENTMESILDALRAVNEDVFYPDAHTPNGRVHIFNEIVYADASGEMQILRRSLLAGAYKFDKRYPQVLPDALMTQFTDNINFLSKLICVGYGFGDLHINAVIRKWLEFTSKRQLEIVNPGMKEIPSFLLHLAPQVNIIAGGATEFFDSAAGITRSRREKLEARFTTFFRKNGAQKAMQEINAFDEMDTRNRVSDLVNTILTSLSWASEKGKDDASSNWDEEQEDMFERLVVYLENLKK